MKKIVLTFAIAFFSVNSFAQTNAGQEEYDKAIIALGKNQDKKANKLLEESYKKGYEPACHKIQTTYWGSDYQRFEAKKIGAEKGYPQLMYMYGVENIDNREKITNSDALKPLATLSITEAYDYLVKSAKAGYEPAYLYLGEQAVKAGDTINAIKIYQVMVNKEIKSAPYKLAILKKDVNAAFDAIKDVKKEDPFLYDALGSGEEIYKAAQLGNDSKFAFDAAKIFGERAAKPSGIKGTQEIYASRASDLYKRACELGKGEGCYRKGLDYLSDYRDHENGMTWFTKALAFGYKIPEAELLKMGNPPSAEDIERVHAKIQAQIEQSIKWAKSHPNEDEIEYKENTANNKTKKYVTQGDMEKIIKANFPSSSSEGERHRREMEKQARDTEKITNGTWNGR